MKWVELSWVELSWDVYTNNTESISRRVDKLWQKKWITDSTTTKQENDTISTNIIMFINNNNSSSSSNSNSNYIVFQFLTTVQKKNIEMNTWRLHYLIAVSNNQILRECGFDVAEHRPHRPLSLFFVSHAIKRRIETENEDERRERVSEWVSEWMSEWVNERVEEKESAHNVTSTKGE
jgi:hypothetical protein